MNIVIFDTETISINKPFCYNVGYRIVNQDFDTLLERDFVVEQCWHNNALFATAYYTDKKPLYIASMKARKTVMDKWGYIMQQMIRDFKAFEVEQAYAYNSDFDERVFAFNCEWYKTANPFDNIPIYDIRGYVHKCIAFRKDFQDFCDKYALYTETGNYSTTAETVTRYLRNDNSFDESHTALADSQIECAILQTCIQFGNCDFGNTYKVYNSIPRTHLQELIVILKDTGEQFNFEYTKKITRNNKIFLTKGEI